MTKLMLTELQAMVEAATEFDRALDREIGMALDGWVIKTSQGMVMLQTSEGDWFADHPGSMYPSFTESADESLALVQRKLPGWVVFSMSNGDLDIQHGQIRRFGNKWRCGLAPDGYDLHGDVRRIMRWPVVYGATLPLAILAALINALITQEASDAEQPRG